MVESIDHWAPKVGFWIKKHPPHPTGVTSVLSYTMYDASNMPVFAPLTGSMNSFSKLDRTFFFEAGSVFKPSSASSIAFEEGL